MKERLQEHWSELAERFAALQDEIEREVVGQQDRWHYRIHENRVRFERGARQAHARMRRSIVGFAREASLLNLLTAPVLYSFIVPLAALDVWIWAYQHLCFPIYDIPRVRRRDYIVIDRHRLGYLNGIEKMNCVYCGYANGLLAYVREVAGRTERYWCPIRHARIVRDPHVQYPDFVDYGDAEGYHRRLLQLRATWRTTDTTGRSRSSRRVTGTAPADSHATGRGRRPGG